MLYQILVSKGHLNKLWHSSFIPLLYTFQYTRVIINVKNRQAISSCTEQDRQKKTPTHTNCFYGYTQKRHVPKLLNTIGHIFKAPFLLLRFCTKTKRKTSVFLTVLTLIRAKTPQKWRTSKTLSKVDILKNGGF